MKFGQTFQISAVLFFSSSNALFSSWPVYKFSISNSKYQSAFNANHHRRQRLILDQKRVSIAHSSSSPRNNFQNVHPQSNKFAFQMLHPFPTYIHKTHHPTYDSIFGNHFVRLINEIQLAPVHANPKLEVVSLILAPIRPFKRNKIYGTK